MRFRSLLSFSSRGQAATFLRNYVIGGILVLLLGFVLYTRWILKEMETHNRALIQPLATLAAHLPAISDRAESELMEAIVAGIADRGRIRFIITDEKGNPLISRYDAKMDAILRGDAPPSDADLQRIRRSLERMNTLSDPVDYVTEDRRIIGRIYFGDVDPSHLNEMPLAVADDLGQPMAWKLFSGWETRETQPDSVPRVRAFMRDAEEHRAVAELQIDPATQSGRFYYELRPLLALQWMPFVQIVLVGGFVLGSLALYRRIRMDEQGAIWSGLAKESAHQLGTPITSLLGWLDLMREGEFQAATPLRVPAEEIFGEMGRDLERLQRIVARFAEVGQPPKKTPLDVNRIVYDAAIYFRGRLPSRSKQTELLEDFKEVPAVMGNENLIQWVVENLIRNALDAIETAPVRSGRVILSTSADAKTNQVVVRVADNGSGIPRHLRRRIFAPGFTTKKHGWGVGLTLVQRIIETYHDGRIRLLETSPQGTTFEIRLPYSPASKTMN